MAQQGGRYLLVASKAEEQHSGEVTPHCVEQKKNGAMRRYISPCCVESTYLLAALVTLVPVPVPPPQPPRCHCNHCAPLASVGTVVAVVAVFAVALHWCLCWPAAAAVVAVVAIPPRSVMRSVECHIVAMM